MWGIWVDDQRVSASEAGSYEATQPSVSIGSATWRSARNVLDTTTGALRRTLLDTADVERHPVHDVVAPRLVQEGGSGRERRLRAAHRLQGLVLDVDHGGAVLGHVAIAGDDDGHRLADVAHLAARERRPVARLVERRCRGVVLHAQGRQQLGEIVTRDHRVHAREGARPRGVDASQHGMRLGAGDERGDQLAGELDVVQVAPASRQQARILDRPHRRSDGARSRRCVAVGHELASSSTMRSTWRSKAPTPISASPMICSVIAPDT